MALCEQCGSISIVKAQFELVDRLVVVFTGKRPFTCRRCGWRGRRNWTDNELEKLRDYGVGGAEPDPALAVLDEEAASTRRQPRNTPRRRPRSTSQTPAERFDLDELDLSSDFPDQTNTNVEDIHAPRSSSAVRKRRTKRIRRRRLRKIGRTEAMTALIIFVVVIVGLTGSCIGVF
jgi:hypothetical protein